MLRLILLLACMEAVVGFDAHTSSCTTDAAQVGQALLQRRAQRGVSPQGSTHASFRHFMRDSRKMFDQLDVDGNSRISVAEADFALFGFSEFDTDGDDELNFDEYFAFTVETQNVLANIDAFIAMVKEAEERMRQNHPGSPLVPARDSIVDNKKRALVSHIDSVCVITDHLGEQVDGKVNEAQVRSVCRELGLGSEVELLGALFAKHDKDGGRDLLLNCQTEFVPFAAEVANLHFHRRARALDEHIGHKAFSFEKLDRADGSFDGKVSGESISAVILDIWSQGDTGDDVKHIVRNLLLNLATAASSEKSGLLDMDGFKLFKAELGMLGFSSGLGPDGKHSPVAMVMSAAKQQKVSSTLDGSVTGKYNNGCTKDGEESWGHLCKDCCSKKCRPYSVKVWPFFWKEEIICEKHWEWDY